MINWPELKFPPINLWSKPIQEYDLIDEIYDLDEAIAIDAENIQRIDILFDLTLERFDANKARLKQLEFLYFCRNGRYPD